MTKQIKQRIVGAIVLLGLAVIFFPVVFNHSGSLHEEPIPSQISFDSNLPTASTKMAALKHKLVQQSQTLKQRTHSQGAQKQASVSHIKQVPSTHNTAKASIPKPKAYTIQLATFSQQKHAEKLQKQLHQMGFIAYIHHYKVNQRDFYKLMVGPVIQHKQAQLLLASLTQKTKLKGVIVQYDPLHTHNG